MTTGSFRQFTAAQRLHYGPGCLAALESELDRVGAHRAMVVCGASLARHDVVLPAVRKALGARLAGVFDGVRAHSPLGTVLAAAAALGECQADAVIALGGGSAVVTARAASILLAEEGGLETLCTRFPPGQRPISPRLDQPKLPQFVIPTTPTTAYGKAGSAVLHPQLGRCALFDPKTRAQALFIDPAFGMTAPATLARGAALNTFAMAIQGLESATRQPLSDALLIHSLRLLCRGMKQLDGDTDGPDLRGSLMLAALMCGQGTETTTGALAAVLGHAVGARYHLDNGLANAILLPHTMQFNLSATRDRLLDLPDLLGQDPAAGPVAAVEAVLTELPIPRRLRELGVEKSGLAQLAENASRDWFLQGNPRPITSATALLPILAASW